MTSQGGIPLTDTSQLRQLLLRWYSASGRKSHYCKQRYSKCRSFTVTSIGNVGLHRTTSFSDLQHFCQATKTRSSMTVPEPIKTFLCLQQFVCLTLFFLILLKWKWAWIHNTEHREKLHGVLLGLINILGEVISYLFETIRRRDVLCNITTSKHWKDNTCNA